MSVYDIDGDKACVLFALDAMFGDTIDWGKDFLTDYYKEFGSVGFSQEHFYLIAESAPVKLLQYGTFTIYYRQPLVYTYIYDRKKNLRYRIHKDTLVMICYGTNDWSHAAAIPSREIIIYITHYNHHALCLPLNGLIIDNRTYEADVEDGIIY